MPTIAPSMVISGVSGVDDDADEDVEKEHAADEDPQHHEEALRARVVARGRLALARGVDRGVPVQGGREV